jgi:hypothetical protein
MDPLDDNVRDAMKALEASATPRDYFDALPGRIEAILDAPETGVGSMQTESEHSQSNAIPPKPPNEDSGLHDIKQLAQSTKTRLSRRQTSQHDIDQSLLTSTSSGLHVVALPDPAKMISLPSVEEARALARSATHQAVGAVDDAPIGATHARAAVEPSSARKGVPVWMYAGGGLAAAAAAVMAFVVFGSGKSGETKNAGSAAASEPRHRDEQAGDEQAAAATQPAPMKSAVAIPADEGVTVSGIVEDPVAAAGAGSGSGSALPADPVAPEVPKESAKKADRADGKATDKGGGGQTVKTDKVVKPDATDTTVKTDKTDKTVKPGGGDKVEGGGPKKLDGAVLNAGDKDELGIGDVLNGDGGKKKDAKPEKTELSSKDVREGLSKIDGKAKGCYGKYSVSGTAKVKLTIDPSGNVTKATATGEFAGTPTGDCVSAAVKSASFPPWTGAPMSTIYVVLLSD